MAEHLPVVYDIPSTLVDLLKPKVANFIHLMPGWVKHLTVSYVDESDEHTAAEVESWYGYRRVYLKLRPRFLTISEKDQEHTIVHEAMHVLRAPVDQLIHSTVDALYVGNPQAKAVFQAAWHLANEATVEDMAQTYLAVIAEVKVLNETPG